MNRIYTDNGQGISTKVISSLDGKTYIISTAKNSNRGWQLAVFRNIFGLSNPFKPLRVNNTATFAEAEKLHSRVEELVIGSPAKDWINWD